MNMHAQVKRGGRGGRRRAEEGMRYSPRMMHPEEARELVENMDRGDLDSKQFKEKLADFTLAMAEDRWEANGETVVIGRSGKVLDGRARLLACIAADMPFPVIVVTGVDDAVFVSIDAHSRRSATDMLAIDEVEHARVVSSALQAIASYLNAKSRDRWRYQGSSAVGTQEIKLLNHSMRDDIATSTGFVMDLRTGKVVPNTVAVACHYLASRHDADIANAFFREFAEAGPEGDSAPAILRKRYLDPASNTTFTYRMAVFSKAWGAYLDKRRPDLAEIDYHGPVERKGGLGDEAFPVIRGIPEDRRVDFAAMRRTGPADPDRTGARGMAALARMRVSEVQFTPELCDQYLLKNGPKGRNRSVRPGHVRDLARMMREGFWLPNGKTIKRTSAGELLDGQHRLRAGSISEKGFWSLVVDGIEPDTFATLDLGQRKSLGNRILAQGDANGRTINSVCTIFWRITHKLVSGEPAGVEAERIYANDKEAIDRSIAVAKADKMRDTLDVSIAAALHRVFALYDEELADRFVKLLATGLIPDARNPIYKLREELKKRGATSLDTHPRKVRAVIRTWNAYVTGKTSRGLVLVAADDEGFPKVETPNDKAPRAEAAAAKPAAKPAGPARTGRKGDEDRADRAA